jgi:hypothetical protein
MVNPFVNVDRSNLARLGGAMKPGSRIRVIRVMMDGSGLRLPVSGRQHGGLARNYRKHSESKDRS